MANSKIVITFSTGAVNIGDIISFKYKDNSIESPIDVLLYSEWRSPKQAKGQINKTNVVGTYDSLMAALDYRTSFEVDYNVPNKFSLIVSGNEVTIEGLTNAIEFSDFYSSTGNESAIITNAAYTNPLTYSIEYLQATNNCTDVKVKVTANKVITNVTSPIVLAPGALTFEFDHIRGVDFNLAFTDGTDNISETETTPSVLENPETNIINKPSGANVLISVNNPDLTLQYSVDGVGYQASALFQTMVVGNYTAYVKDQFGCVKSSPFEITAFTPQIDVLTPIFYISNANSIGFKKVEIWDNKDIYKTDENTLSFEELKLTNGIVRPYVQRWQSNDTIPTQFISNYGTHTIKVLENGNETLLSAVKKSNNIGLQDKRDARIFEMSDGKTGIYFISGNIYDYGTTDVSGSYNSNSELPDWAVINRNVYIEEVGDYLILENIIDDPSKNKILVFSPGYIGVEKDTTVSTIYNLFDWEIYEFDIDMSVYEDKCFQVSIDATDTTFTAISHLSEIQNVLEYQKGTIELKAWSNTNGDIFYPITGIKHTLRLEYGYFRKVDENEKDNRFGDDSISSISSLHRDKKELKVIRIPTRIVDKVQQMCGLDNILLNRQPFTSEAPDSPEVLGNTNMHNLKVVFFKTKEQLKSTYNGVGIIIPEVPQSPSLIDLGSGGFLSVT